MEVTYPLFIPVSGITPEMLSSKDVFYLVREERGFPISMGHLTKFHFLANLAHSADDGSETQGALQFPIDSAVCTDRALHIVASYCRLPLRTSSASLPRDVNRFYESITHDEHVLLHQTFSSMSNSNPHESMQLAFEVLKLAEFLLHDDLLTLMCGFVATLLHRRATTAGMRELLGIPPDVKEESLFTEETLEIIRSEDAWMQGGA